MSNDYIRFDWAMKRLLRDKANFVILEGLLTALLNRNIHIKSILESEGNQEYKENLKANGVPLDVISKSLNISLDELKTL